MKKFIYIMLCFLIIILSGCGSKPPGSKPEYGHLELTFSPDGMEIQTIKPNLDMNVNSYDVDGAGPDGNTFKEQGLEGPTWKVESLKAGDWTVIVKAKNAAGVVIGEGNKQATVIANQTVSVEIPVTPLTGTGTLRVTISWEAGALAAPSVTGVLTREGESSGDNIEFTIDKEESSARHENTNLAAGYYNLTLQVKDGSAVVWETKEAIRVRVLAGQISEGSYQLEELAGDGEVIINPDLQNPITITFSGCQARLSPDESMTITAETSEPVDTYQWELNGKLLEGETGASIVVGPGLEIGNYRLVLIVTKGNIISSEELTFTVAEIPPIVTFADPNLEAVIREAINKPAGYIYPSDLLGLTIVDAYEKGIQSLSGLEYCVDLEELDLWSNQVSDISVLSELINLEALELGNNQISDLTPLTGLTNLWVLGLGSNQFSDINVLSGLTNLLYLDLCDSQISDISVLSGLTNLSYLYLHFNQISDISALSGLTNLSFLHLRYNQISDISALSGLTNLSYLGLNSNQISDISALSGLTNLLDLGLGSNQISDISALSGLTNLSELWLESNQISDISALSGLTNLSRLDLTNNSGLNTSTGSPDREIIDDLIANGCEVYFDED